MGKNKPVLYLSIIVEDIDPTIEGPFETEEDRLLTAVEHRDNDPDKNDGIFKLDIVQGVPVMSSYRSVELEPIEPNEE